MIRDRSWKGNKGGKEEEEEEGEEKEEEEEGEEKEGQGNGWLMVAADAAFCRRLTNLPKKSRKERDKGS
jgi:hypothetical protein